MYTAYALKAGPPFSQSSTLYYKKLHSLTVKKITITFLLLLDRVFAKLCGTNLKPQFF